MFKIVLSLLFVTQTSLWAQLPSAEEVALRHTATTQSLKSLRCDYLHVLNFQDETPETTRKGKYLRVNDVVFLEEKIGKSAVFSLRRDLNSIRSFQETQTAKKTPRYLAAIKTSNALLGTTDLYLPLLFQVQHPDEPRVLNYSEFYAKCKTSVSRASYRGRPCVKVVAKYQFKEVDFECHNFHDANIGYLVVASEKYSQSSRSKTLMKIETDDWVTTGSSHFPRKVALSNYVKGKLDYTHGITCSSIVMNEAIEPKELELPVVPDGTPCTNFMTMKKYQINSSWNRVGPETDFVVMKSEALISGVDAASNFDFRPTTEEPRSPWIWVAIASAILLATLLTWKWIRRKREGEDEE